MSLTIALQNATSGLQAAQAALGAVSDNIANVNTPGYVRKAVVQQQLVVDGRGAGVDIQGVKRITSQYLQSASLTAGSDSSRFSVYAQYLDNAQALFGDPSGNDYFFNLPDNLASNFSAAADDPSSSLLRTQAVNTLSDFLSQADRINTQVASLSKTVDSQTSDDVSKVNSLLTQIDKLNTDIARAKVLGSDSTGSENIQGDLLNQLSGLMNVRITQRAGGGVDIRSTEGVALVAQGGASTLTYNATAGTPGYVTATTPGAVPTATPITISSGEIRGLLDLRNTKLPGLSDQLGEFVSRTAQQLNAASNASSASPPPATLNGRNTGLDLPTAVSGFTGQTTLALTNASGVVQQTVAIDFTAGTMSVNGGAGTAFTPATFLAKLNAALGAGGTASFANGALSISAAGGNGVAIDEGTSQKAGEGFSQFFGLNDLVSSTGLSTYDTGLSAGDPNGFTPGDQMTLRISTPGGNPIRDVVITVPPAGSPTVGDLVNTLNNAANGVGLYGSFTLDAQGALTFTGNAPQNAQVSVVSDNTQRGAGGPSISALFGIGVQARSTRAGTFVVNPSVASNPMTLPLGTLNLSVAAGQSAITPGDGSGALRLAAAGQVPTLLKAAGDLGNVTMTLQEYAAQFGGSVGRDAATADSQSSSATAVKTEADAKRQSVEGVNIDEELIHLTTYQQAYSANARMIQATKDLFTVLENILN